MESEAFTSAPIGRPTARPNLLEKNSGVNKGSGSTTAAYAKIGSAVVAAGVVTWLGVPLFANVTQMVLAWTAAQLQQQQSNMTAANATTLE